MSDPGGEISAGGRADRWWSRQVVESAGGGVCRWWSRQARTSLAEHRYLIVVVPTPSLGTCSTCEASSATGSEERAWR